MELKIKPRFPESHSGKSRLIAYPGYGSISRDCIRDKPQLGLMKHQGSLPEKIAIIQILEAGSQGYLSIDCV